MKPHFVSDGESRLLGCSEHQARLQELRMSIKARHAAEFASAGILRKLTLWWRMRVEFRSERRKIEPSPDCLYYSQIVVATEMPISCPNSPTRSNSP
jgi:hypothetical protein